MNWIECGIMCVVALVAALLLVPLAKRIAVRFDAVDYPSARRVNTVPIPRMGGIAIAGGIAVAIAVLAAGIACGCWESPFVPHPDLRFEYLGVAAGLVIVFLVGAVDDVRCLSPKVKFVGQVVAACVVVANGLLLDNIHVPFMEVYLHFGWFAYPLTVFYLVAFANIVNLIDGLDGLAAGISAICAMGFFAFAVISSRPDVAVLCAILIGACLGFLRYNFHPASIFMGDCGSLFLGFYLGCLSLMAIARTTAFVSLLLPIILAAVPIVDTGMAIVRRLRAHRPIDEADKQHTHHRLMEAGYSQRKTVLIMWAWTAGLSICGVVMTAFRGAPRYIIGAFVLVAIIVIICKLKLFGPVLRHCYPTEEQQNANDTQRKDE